MVFLLFCWLLFFFFSCSCSLDAFSNWFESSCTNVCRRKVANRDERITPATTTSEKNKIKIHETKSQRKTHNTELICVYVECTRSKREIERQFGFADKYRRWVESNSYFTRLIERTTNITSTSSVCELTIYTGMMRVEHWQAVGKVSYFLYIHRKSVDDVVRGFVCSAALKHNSLV